MAGIELKHIQKAYTVDGRTLPVLKDICLQIPRKQHHRPSWEKRLRQNHPAPLSGGFGGSQTAEKFTLRSRIKPPFVFQEPRLMPWLTVWDNTIFGLKKHSYDTGEIQTLLETVGLDGFQKAYPHQLSGGMQQRTAIARALAYAPSFLLMDEPFAALDHFTRTQLQKELIRLQKSQNTGILFVTHSIDEALLLGHKIAFLEDGCIKKEFLLDTDCENRDLLSKELIELKREILAQLHL